jgi:ABC-type antimicrobial peptide transport system permease subunit
MKAVAFAAYLIKDLLYDLGRSLLTVASLAAIILGFLLTAAISTAFLEFGSQVSTGSHNLMILSADSIDPSQGSLTEEVLETAAQAIREKFGPQGLRRASPAIFRTMRIVDWVMQVFAVPRQDMADVYRLTLLEGRYPEDSGSNSKPAEIVATQEAMQITGWSMGHTVEILGQKFQIVGIVRYEGGKLASLWMTYPVGQNLFGTRIGFQIGTLQIANDLDTETVRAYLESLPELGPAYAVYLEQQLNERYATFIRAILSFSAFLNVLALSVVSFGAYNATSLTLAERSHEIAILRIVGFSAPVVRRFLFGRALLQTLVAYGVGWALALLITQEGLVSPNISIIGVTLPLRLSAHTLLLGLALVILFAWLGVWLTARGQERQKLAVLLKDG